MSTRPPSRQPIPPDARQVFSGTIFDVYQWDQALFDGSTAVFEKIKRRDTVNVIPVAKDGRIILTKQEQPGEMPFIGLPGGRIDDGEAPVDAGKRELLEETGFSGDEWMLWDACQPFSKVDWATYTYVVRDCVEVQSPEVDAGEKIELFLVDFDEFVHQVALAEFRDNEVALKVLRLKELGRLYELRNLVLDQ